MRSNMKQDTGVLLLPSTLLPVLIKTGAHYPERATALYLCHGIFTDQFIFRLKFPRIHIPEGASLTTHKLRK